MIGIRIHGRGGQGAVTFGHIIAVAATYEGKYGQSSQGLAIERRGAPVQGFARIGDRPIAERGLVNNPKYVVVMDPDVIKAAPVEAGMTEDGLLVVNAPFKPKFDHACVNVDATSIALEVLGRPITNTVMLGAFVAATKLVTIESIEKAARFILGKKVPEKVIEKNLVAILRAYDDALAMMA